MEWSCTPVLPPSDFPAIMPTAISMTNTARMPLINTPATVPSMEMKKRLSIVSCSIFDKDISFFAKYRKKSAKILS